MIIFFAYILACASSVCFILRSTFAYPSLILRWEEFWILNFELWDFWADLEVGVLLMLWFKDRILMFFWCRTSLWFSIKKLIINTRQTKHQVWQMCRKWRIFAHLWRVRLISRLIVMILQSHIFQEKIWNLSFVISYGLVFLFLTLKSNNTPNAKNTSSDRVAFRILLVYWSIAP